MKKLKINKKFKELIPSLSDDEFIHLEETLKKEGIRDDILTWKGFIIDGHNRYTIANRWDLPFNTSEKEFDNEDEVLAWMVNNQMSRRNMTVAARVALLSKYQQMIADDAKERKGGRPKKAPVNLPAVSKGDTRDKIAQMAGTSGRTVDKVNTVMKEAKKNIQDAMLSGSLSVDAAYRETKNKTGYEKPEKKPLTAWEKVRNIISKLDDDEINALIDKLIEVRDFAKELKTNSN